MEENNNTVTEASLLPTPGWACLKGEGIYVSRIIKAWMTTKRRLRDPIRDTLLRELNRKIDKTFHKHFDDPSRCIPAILADTTAHQLVGCELGIPPQEIRRRTLRYLPKEIDDASTRSCDKPSRESAKTPRMPSAGS